MRKLLWAVSVALLLFGVAWNFSLQIGPAPIDWVTIGCVASGLVGIALLTVTDFARRRRIPAR